MGVFPSAAVRRLEARIVSDAGPSFLFYHERAAKGNLPVPDRRDRSANKNGRPVPQCRGPDSQKTKARWRRILQLSALETKYFVPDPILFIFKNADSDQFKRRPYFFIVVVWHVDRITLR
ncbi:hypothetical protein [Paenibacillus cymbidii]|uniref:hypothetical protein n=1 Tax=Paenibacillus cymbidii TaxID=1639034 RepID=UPI001436BE47|nr:hypothetical protein [Paenibacillus cymbidii]